MRGDWEILQKLAGEWNLSWNYRFSDQVFEHLAKSEPVLQGLTYEAIGKEGVLLNLEKEKVNV